MAELRNKQKIGYGNLECKSQIGRSRPRMYGNN